MSLPRNAIEAARVGSKYYFSGMPCLNGHISHRWTGSYRCTTCAIESKYTPRPKKYYKRDGRNGEGKRLNAEAMRKHRALYLERHRETNAYSRSRLLGQKVFHDRELCLAFYKYAIDLTNSTGIDHEVDHIFPVRSDWVCGLHNPFNLRVIPKEINRRKNNKRSFVNDLHEKAFGGLNG